MMIPFSFLPTVVSLAADKILDTEDRLHSAARKTHWLGLVWLLYFGACQQGEFQESSSYDHCIWCTYSSVQKSYHRYIFRIL